MTVLRYISTLYTALLAPVLLFILFDFRYPRRKTILLTVSFLVPIILANAVLLAILGPVIMSSLLLLTGALPALTFFWFLSKHRDFRLLFTFCFTSTIKLVGHRSDSHCRFLSGKYLCGHVGFTISHLPHRGVYLLEMDPHGLFTASATGDEGLGKFLCHCFDL